MSTPGQILDPNHYSLGQGQRVNSCMLNTILVGDYLRDHPEAIELIKNNKGQKHIDAIQRRIEEANQIFEKASKASKEGLDLEEVQRIMSGKDKAAADILNKNSGKNVSFALEMQSSAGVNDNQEEHIQIHIAQELEKENSLIQVNSLLSAHATVFGHTGNDFWQFDALGATLRIFKDKNEAIEAMVAIYNNDKSSQNAPSSGDLTQFSLIKKTPRANPDLEEEENTQPPLPPAQPKPPLPSAKISALQQEKHIQHLLDLYQNDEDENLINDISNEFKSNINLPAAPAQARQWLKTQIGTEIEALTSGPASKGKKISPEKKQAYQDIRTGIDTGLIKPAGSSSSSSPSQAEQKVHAQLHDRQVKTQAKEVRLAAQVSKNSNIDKSSLPKAAQNAIKQAKDENKPLVLFTLKTHINKKNKPKEMIHIDDEAGVFGDNEGLLKILNSKQVQIPKITFYLNKLQYTVQGEMQFEGTEHEYVAFKKVDSKGIFSDVSDQDIADYALENKTASSLTEVIMKKAAALVPKETAVAYAQTVETAAFTAAYKKGP